MKKVLLSLMFVCLLSGFAFAEITVISGGKMARYPDGTKLKITAVDDVTVMYHGQVIVIPKGESVSLRCSGASENNNIFLTSDNGFKNVKIGNKAFSSGSSTAMVIDKGGSVAVEQGTVAAVNKDGSVAFVEAGKTTSVDHTEAVAKAVAKAAEISNPKPASVVSSNKDSNSTTVVDTEDNESAYEQAAKDEDISPSAPRI